MSERYGTWAVKVEQAGMRSCDAAVGERTCRRGGHYGWGTARYCAQHHPDWYGWYAEYQRVQEIAKRSFAKATR